MDKSKLSSQIRSKLGSYTWMKLSDMADGQVVNILVRINNDDDVKIFKDQIESIGFKFISSFGNKATLRGNVRNIPLLAGLDFIEYIEIGMAVASER